MNQRETDNARRILGLLGLCRRAGKLVMGTSLACLAMAEKKPPALAVVSKEASQNTRKRMTTKSEYYGIPLLTLEASPTELGAALGKQGEIAALVVKDANIAKELIRIDSTGKEPPVSTED